MILNDPRNSTTYRVTLADGDNAEISGFRLETEGGALVIWKSHSALEVAFGPGAWLEVSEVR